MVKIVDNRRIKVCDILASKIPLGFFLGRIGEYDGLFLRNFDGVVFVENPQKTWTPCRDLEVWTLKVYNYQPLDQEQITITIG